MLKRVINEDTGLYFFELGTEMTTGAMTKGTRYLVSAMADSESALPNGLQVGDIFICQDADKSLASGDIAKPLTMSKICGFQNIDGQWIENKLTLLHYVMIQQLTELVV